jgi:CheY-like chemotaxis protein
MQSTAALDGKRVLIVDDNRLNIFALESALQSLLNIDILSVRSGSAALEILSNDDHGIDFVLMDMMMPGMNGYEATRKIRDMTTQANKVLTIIAVTARAMKEDRERCLNAGVTDYIAKPVSIVELIEVMAKYCDD